MLAASAKFESMRPSLMSLLGPQFTDMTSGIGSLVLKQFNGLATSKLIGDMGSTLSISKMISDQYASSFGSLGKALAEMRRVQFDGMFQTAELQNAMLGFSRALTDTTGTRNVSSLLSQAASLQGILEDKPDIEQFATEFFEDQPELAESIEELPFLINLSSTERKLIVWFIGVVVSIYVTLGLLTLNRENPDLHSVLGDLGIAGPAAGIAAGKGTKKLLDMLPASNEDHV